MDSLLSEDGQHFIRSLAQFIRQHEKALANSLQLSVHRKQSSLNASNTSLSSVTSGTTPTTSSTPTSSLAAAFSFAGLNFMSHSIKAAHLTLTPHHLFYLLSRIEELAIPVGPMNVRLENLNSDPSPTNYVSFLQTRHAPNRGRSDRDSIHSVSSMRSVMSGMSAFWSSIGLGSGTSKSEKAKAATEADLKYLYSAFTKLPSLRLTSDHRARLIKGYEEFPFDTAVPLFAFKNVQQLDIVDLDFRQFHGWDRLADQLCLLTVKRANLDDPSELLTDIVLDDAEKRRRRSTKGGRGSPTPTSSWTVPSTPGGEYARSHSDPGSPAEGGSGDEEAALRKDKAVMSGSVSPKRPSPSRPTSSYRHVRSYSSKINRSGSGSSNSSDFSVRPYRSDSYSNLPSVNLLPPSKWQRLKYLSLADNSLTSLSAKSLAPLASTLRSLNLSSNLFTEIPESLASLTRLTSLDLSNCMIESLQSLSRSPIPAILTIKLKSNRLQSLAGVERLLSLENINVQDNLLSDPMEAARLTSIPNLRRVWVKNNPFTKHHGNHRITIFNVFRNTPGYLEDIILDDNGPSFSEKKQLVERVPEVERKLSQPTIRIAETPIIIQELETTKPQRSSPEEVLRTSNRRKKAPRRRIVDLAHDDGYVRAYSEAAIPTRFSLDSSATVRTNIEKVLPRSSNSVDMTSKINTGLPIPATDEGTRIRPSMDQKPSTPKALAPPAELHDLELNVTDPGKSGEPALSLQRDEYRTKIEALRQEFGSNWLSALREQSWHNDHHLEIERLNNLTHSSLHRANSHAITSGGRTLG